MKLAALVVLLVAVLFQDSAHACTSEHLPGADCNSQQDSTAPSTGDSWGGAYMPTPDGQGGYFENPSQVPTFGDGLNGGAEYAPGPYGSGGLIPGNGGGEGVGGQYTSIPEGQSLHPVRAFLKEEQIPPENYGAYGIVVLKSRPTSANREKLLMVCQSYVAHFDRDELIPADVPVSERMITIWPVYDPDSSQAQSDDCEFVLGNYVLHAASMAMLDAEKQGMSFEGEGPFLIGWSPSNTRGQPDKLVLVVDMSSSNSQASIDSAFDFWKDKIVHDPSLWKDGFSLADLREAIKQFVDQYGSGIVDQIKMAGL